MPNVVILGAQWGDEGKGKIVDYFTEDADIVARYQGGHNAGHTVIINGKKFILHIIPSGIFHKDKICVIGNGVVINPAALLKEVENLHANGIETEGRLLISKYAHVIMPYHLAIESAVENSLGDNKIGTTLKGTGPAYTDKIARSGIRVGDLYDDSVLKDRIQRNIERVNFLLTNLYSAEPLDGETIFHEYKGYAERMKPYVADTAVYLNNAMKESKQVIFEGAQGTLLDIDHGTYPYVTSSSATAGGVCTGLAVSPRAIDEVIGVVKAYTTRVGGGPFPTEIMGELGETIRQEGGEFGSTTGRPRRCGWLDIVALRHAMTINGFTGIVLTKLDVLDKLDKIKICVAYQYKREILDYMPREIRILDSCKPVYEEMDGWKTKTDAIRSYNKLPEKARQYIEHIETLLGINVDLVSTGPDRQQIILRRNPLRNWRS